ncbi:MAG: hypothetical protein KDI51_02990 [Xanthomonadales bacterium]|nr:hypothetical protein [Xanthomonadales bacterium]
MRRQSYFVSRRIETVCRRMHGQEHQTIDRLRWQIKRDPLSRSAQVLAVEAQLPTLRTGPAQDHGVGVHFGQLQRTVGRTLAHSGYGSRTSWPSQHGPFAWLIDLNDDRQTLKGLGQCGFACSWGCGMYVSPQGLETRRTTMLDVNDPRATNRHGQNGRKPPNST